MLWAYLRFVPTLIGAVIVTTVISVGSASAQSDRDVCLKESGDKAIAACDRAIRQNPKDADAYSNRGMAWNEKGDNDKAIADFNEAIRLNPKDAFEPLI